MRRKRREPADTIYCSADAEWGGRRCWGWSWEQGVGVETVCFHCQCVGCTPSLFKFVVTLKEKGRSPRAWSMYACLLDSVFCLQDPLIDSRFPSSITFCFAWKWLSKLVMISKFVKLKGISVHCYSSRREHCFHLSQKPSLQPSFRERISCKELIIWPILPKRKS